MCRLSTRELPSEPVILILLTRLYFKHLKFLAKSKKKRTGLEIGIFKFFVIRRFLAILIVKFLQRARYIGVPLHIQESIVLPLPVEPPAVELELSDVQLVAV